MYLHELTANLIKVQTKEELLQLIEKMTDEKIVYTYPADLKKYLLAFAKKTADILTTN